MNRNGCAAGSHPCKVCIFGGTKAPPYEDLPGAREPGSETIQFTISIDRVTATANRVSEVPVSSRTTFSGIGTHPMASHPKLQSAIVPVDSYQTPKTARRHKKIP